MVAPRKLALIVLPGRFAVCRLPAAADIPTWAIGAEFCSVTRTSDELSIVCIEGAAPDDIPCERGWRCLRIAGTMGFTLTGVLSSLVAPLAAAEIGVFAISTFDTDYLLIPDKHFERALEVLHRAGHGVA
jgi:hypothetical protein